MNLDGLTEGQRRSVVRVDGPLLISAGAGSGKTFTLTQRIAYALTSKESGVNNIDEVLAITFTEKAAGEIKARVKNTLRQEDLSDQALRVDASWISTIHGMCSRILRSHALELGIDPGFAIIADSTKNELIAQAINEALGKDNEIISRKSYSCLFDEYPARSFGFGSSSVASMLENMLKAASNLRNGLDDISFGPAPRSAPALAHELLLAFEQIMPILEQAGSSASAEEARVRAEEALVVLGHFLEQKDKDASLLHFAKLLENIVFLPKKFGGAEVKEAVGEFQAFHARIIDETLLGLAHPVLVELKDLAAEVSARYEKKKHEIFVMDNDDLLIKTFHTLEKHPEIASQYQEQFKLVMVDEFQDTSQIQIDIIEKLAGKRFEHLCTVGDAQQSIYRFRGADVNVYEAHKNIMRSSEVGATYVELDKNFRSHQDVLSFVDRIFEQEQVFGEKFMSLKPDLARHSLFNDESPRIDIMLTTRSGEKNSGVSTADARRAEACGIAQRFAALRDRGYQASDMVVLLGKMTNAETYAQALRDFGFECVVAGGSLFDKAPEVRLISRLAEVLANQTNSAALFEVLSSDLFSLSTSDFLQLTTYCDKDSQSIYRCSLYKGFARLKAQTDLDDRPQLQHVLRVMNKAWNRVGRDTLSSIIHQILIDSGWLSRTQNLGAYGIALAGNVYKAIRILQDIESAGAKGASQTALEFSTQLAGGLAQAPGALTGGENSVIKIMTIHASKGLEFPFVALAEFSDSNSSSGKLLIENYEGHTFASLALGTTLDKFPSLAKRFEKTAAIVDENLSDARFAQGQTIAGFRAKLKNFIALEERAEAHRKFYVGLTRASEALIVAMSAKISSKNPLSSYKGITEDLRSALCGCEDFPSECASIEYGGTQPAAFERISVLAHDDEVVDEEKSSTKHTKEFNIPVFIESKALRYQKYQAFNEGVFSYSSLAAKSQKNETYEDVYEKLDFSIDAMVEPGFAPRLHDADKATDLGSVFHRVAQYAIETHLIPSKDKITMLSKQHGLSQKQHHRLEQAVDRWFASDLFARARRSLFNAAEVPFFIELENAWMEGEIDLLFSEEPKGAAFVVDYKTGGKADESDDALHKKHLLQASCYAYAVLQQGYQRVELYFVRVEHKDTKQENEPQAIQYCFGQDDIHELKQYILTIYKSVSHSA